MSFEPNWASPPGDTISRLMSASGLTEAELADQIGLDDNLVSKLLDGQLQIAGDLAEALSNVLGASPEFWMERHDQYMSDLQRLRSTNLTHSTDTWARAFPIRSLKEYGWLPKEARGKSVSDALLEFFGSVSLNDWKARYSLGIGQVAFRTSFAHSPNEEATLAWLRSGEIQLSKLSLPKYSPERFALLLPNLKKLSALKHPKLFLPKLQQACMEVGVGVATSRSLTGCRASGASWVSQSGNPFVLLSFRHMSEDHFWFTFFHEAAHVILHGESHLDLDGSDPSPFGDDGREKEANEFAQDVLVPEDLRITLFESIPTRGRVRATARQSNVTPGIIVGQLQKAGVLRQNQFNDLKRRYMWSDDPCVPELYQPRKYTK